MILSQLVNEAYLAYRGKLSNVPAPGDEKYTRILTIANRNQRQWALDSNVDWPSRYEIRQVGQTTVGTQQYDLDDDIIRISDYVQLINTSNQKTYVVSTLPQGSAGLVNGCYISGTNPKQLTFLKTINSSNAGMTIQVPCFTLPADMVVPNDAVAVPNPQWLVYATAAELARNDYSKEEQYQNLQGIANDLYQNMVNEAESNGYLMPNGAANQMPQAPSLDYNSYGSIY